MHGRTCAFQALLIACALPASTGPAGCARVDTDHGFGDAATDEGSDAAQDTGQEAAYDVLADLEPDPPADTPMDPSGDDAADSMTDPPPDLPDVPVDTVPSDTGGDPAVDAAIDSVADTTTDTATDTATDTVPDGAADPGPACGSTTCLATETCCYSSYCADLQNDVGNCGACAIDCTSGLYDRGDGCSAGVCRCHGGSACSGTDTSVCCPASTGCVNTLSDEDNCGGCGDDCGVWETCSGGGCYS